ncbi:TPA: hypothetical protein ACPYV0_002575 [Citrobacter amalonaticus]
MAASAAILFFIAQQYILSLRRVLFFLKNQRGVVDHNLSPLHDIFFPGKRPSLQK